MPDAQKGQITILVLLLGLLGLTTGLSVASRALSDLKQVSYVDSGTKTLAGAEAGLQAGLSALTNNPAIADGGCATDESININGLSLVSFQVCKESQDYAIADVAKDDVFEIDLGSSVSSANIIWDNPDAAMEIIVMHSDTNKIDRYAYNGVGVGAGNNFAPATARDNCSVSTFCPKGPDDFLSEWSCAPNIGNLTNAKVRIKPIYQSARVGVCGTVAIGSPAFRVIGTATTANGTTSRVEALKYPPALPSIFDNVIYTKGSLSR